MILNLGNLLGTNTTTANEKKRLFDNLYGTLINSKLAELPFSAFSLVQTRATSFTPFHYNHPRVWVKIGPGRLQYNLIVTTHLYDVY